jgi:uncharacterized iron-regulated membrane protein
MVLNSGLYTCRTDTPVHFALVILEMGSCELFALTDLKQILPFSASKVARITVTLGPRFMLDVKCSLFIILYLMA